MLTKDFIKEVEKLGYEVEKQGDRIYVKKANLRMHLSTG